MIIMLYSTLIILICFLVLLNTRHAWTMHDARRRGKLPQKGKATMYDVRNLLMNGERDLAIQVYCEIFNTTPLAARKDIEELERSVKKV